MGARRWLGLALIAGALAAVAVLALNGSGGTEAGPATQRSAAAADPAGTCATPRGRTVRVRVAVASRGERAALVHLSARARGRVALVLALHGARGSGASMERYSGLSELADREGFGVVYPDSNRSLWRIRADDGGADVDFLDALIDALLAGGCFDDQRISAAGVSNGAGMAVRYACSGDRLAGLVSVAGGYRALPPCQARRPLSVLEIHGTADTVVPYRGTPPERRGDVLRFLRSWVALDACPSTPRRTRPRPRVLRLDWQPCRGGTAVSHLRLAGAGHGWPGANAPAPGSDLGISASEEVWKFVSRHRLAPAP